MIALTEPIYPVKERIRPCPTFQHLNEANANPYDQIIAREVKNWFDHSKMVGIFHINPINGEEFFKARVAFHKNGMQLKKYGNSIMKLALKGTKYEELLVLQANKTFCTVYAFGTEQTKVSTVLNIIKKIPQMHLMCGIVEDRLLSKNELVEYGNMPDISIVRSQLANVLNMAGVQLVQNLQSHQSNLVNILDAHVRVNEKPIENAAEPVIESAEKSEEVKAEEPKTS